jgi:excinuclease ABC subunit C
MVVFTDGYPDKKEYRKFKIKTVEGQSDVDCLEEVIRRRLKHATDYGLQTTDDGLQTTDDGQLTNGKTVDCRPSSVDQQVDCRLSTVDQQVGQYWPLPDIFLIDGGLPQVNKVQSVFDELGVTVPIVGIAKGVKRKRNDFIFSKPNKQVLIWVNKNQEMLIRVRDEAHRFAIAYQRKIMRM